MRIHSLSQDTVLVLHGLDPYDAHTALRHMLAVDFGEHTCYVALSPEMRRDRAFTPWLRDGTTVRRDAKMEAAPWRMNLAPRCPPASAHVLAFCTPRRHVHCQDATAARHAASFAVRVGGKSVTALVDTGATCSCISKQAALSMGLHIVTDPSVSVDGIGGAAAVAGHVNAPVKVGKVQLTHSLVVLEKPVAGYSVLLGEDYLRRTSGGVRFSQTHCYFDIEFEGQTVHLSRPIQESRSVCVLNATESALPCLSPAESPGDDVEMIASQNQFDKVMRDISANRQVAYQVTIKPPKADDPSQSSRTVPDCVQTVIDKHSQEGGTLCGDIPFGATANCAEMRIDIEPNTRPVHIRQFRLAPSEKEALLSKTDEFIKRGWIEPSTSPWHSAVLFVPKPNGGLRFCVDFRFLNQATAKDRHPLPDIPQLLDQMNGATIYSALDLCSGFYQIPLDKDSRHYTAFSTPYGLYQWCVMPMGLSNSPAVFQRAMNAVLADHIRAGYCLVYLDDVLIMSSSPEEHAKHLDAVLTSLHDARLYCQLPKCDFALSELRYLGHLVDGRGVRPDPKKVATLHSWEPPLPLVEELNLPSTSLQHARSLTKRIAKATRSFLGFMQYFSRFIPRFSTLASCLYDVTKDTPDEWTSACTESWNILRACLANATLMRHPDPSLPFHVYFDASLTGIGGLLMQDHAGDLFPVAFCARRLQPAETRYTTTEQEFLAMVYALRTWRCYLEGIDFFAHTDHEPLTWLASQKSLNRRQARWTEFLSRFSYELLYIKGDKNVCADALSRMCALPVGDTAAESLPGDVWPHSCAALTPPFSYRPRRAYSASDLTVGTGRSLRLGPGTSRLCPALQPAHVDAAQEHAHRGDTAFVARAYGDNYRRPARRGVGGDDFFVAALLDAAGRAVSSASHPPAAAVRSVDVDAGNSVNLGGHTRRRAGEAEPRSPRAPSSPRSHPGSGVRSATKPSVSNPVGTEVPPPAGPALDPSPTLSHEDVSMDTSALPVPGNEEQRGSLREQADHLASHELLFDTLFTRLRSAIKSDPAVETDEQREKLSLTELYDLLWHDQRRLYIPDKDNLRQDILYWHHDVPWAAHLGISKTLHLLKHQFYWPNMKADVENYVRTCVDCQSNKTDRRRRTPALNPLVPPSSCWRTVGVDLIVDLPPSDEGHSAVCVFVCHLSKMVRLVPTSNSLSAPGFAKLFFRNVFPHYGFPLQLVADRGPQWNSEFWKELCRLAGVDLTLSTAFHPQTNGLTERTNEVIEACLRHFVSTDMKDWDDYLPLVEYALNSAYHDAIQSTPFRMNRITIPANPWEVLVHNSRDCSTELSGWMGVSPLFADRLPMTAQDAQRTYVQANAEYQRARRCVELAKTRMKAIHDGKGVTSHFFVEGQLVWFNIKNVSLRHDSRRHKLLPKFWGPFKIIELVGNNAARLDLPAHLRSIHPVVSVQLLKPHFQRPGQPLPSAVVDSDLEFELERIVDFHLVSSRKRDVPGIVEFRVRWKGGSLEDTWHEPDAFENAQHVLQSYLQQLNKRDRKRVLKLFDAASLERLPLTLRQIIL